MGIIAAIGRRAPRTRALVALIYGALLLGAVLKPSAATPELLVHRGRAVVFEDIDD